MADKHMFDNDDVFTKDENIDNTVTLDTSETLATQGNVINSLKIFWARLKAKLVHAITRTDTSKAVGGKYHPIFVNEDGGVQVCNPTTLIGSVTNNNINLDQIKPLYSGQIVCITVTNTTTNNTSFLTINNKNVYYPTGVQVKVSDVINNTTYLFTFISGDGDKWILNNKINVVSTDNPGLMTSAQYNKLNGIANNANNYTLPTADDNTIGGVKLGYTTDGNNYKVQKDNSNNLYVYVPWTDNDTHYTAYLRAGDNISNNNGSTDNNNTYLKIVDGDEVTSTLKISGSGGTTISSNQGIITISSQEPYTPTNISTSNKDPSRSYTVKGAGTNATTNYYLAGNGTWVKGILVPIPNEEGKTLKSHSNGTVYWG